MKPNTGRSLILGLAMSTGCGSETPSISAIGENGEALGVSAVTGVASPIGPDWHDCSVIGSDGIDYASPAAPTGGIITPTANGTTDTVVATNMNLVPGSLVDYPIKFVYGVTGNRGATGRIITANTATEITFSPPLPNPVRTNESVAIMPLCRAIAVSCNGLPTAVAQLARAPVLNKAGGPTGTDGLMVFHNGASGTTWGLGQHAQSAVVNGMMALYMRWSVGWPDDGTTSSAGVSTVHYGIRTPICRPATAFKWAFDNLRPDRSQTSTGKAPAFCVMGHSFGATALAGALAAYDMDKYIDYASVRSGPPHTNLASMCTNPQDPGQTLTCPNTTHTGVYAEAVVNSKVENWALPYAMVNNYTGTRTCGSSNPPAQDQALWANQSVAAVTGPNEDYDYPNTQVDINTCSNVTGISCKKTTDCQSSGASAACLGTCTISGAQCWGTTAPTGTTGTCGPNEGTCDTTNGSCRVANQTLGQAILLHNMLSGTPLYSFNCRADCPVQENYNNAPTGSNKAIDDQMLAGCILRHCDQDADCTSGSATWCRASDRSCQTPTCSDGAQNAAETDVDCGGGSCGACADTQRCASASDCASGVCTSGTCETPTCSDGLKNGAETATDCGGGSCSACANGSACRVDSDCASARCSALVCAQVYAPNPPTVAVTGTTNNTVGLSWTPGATGPTAGATTSYVIEARYGTGAWGPPLSAPTETTSLSTQDVGPTSGTPSTIAPYQYRIKARNAGGDSAWVTFPNAPTAMAPSAVGVTGSANGVTVSWSYNATNEKRIFRYDVARWSSTGGGSCPCSNTQCASAVIYPVNTPTSRSYTDTTTGGTGTSYCYAVRGVGPGSIAGSAGTAFTIP